MSFCYELVLHNEAHSLTSAPPRAVRLARGRRESHGFPRAIRLGRGRVAARFTHHRAAPSRSRPAKDVTPWQCPWAFARCHRLRNRLRALRVTVTLSLSIYRRHQCRELVERSLGMCGWPLESDGEPRSGVASAACAKILRGVRVWVGLGGRGDRAGPRDP